MSQGDDIRELYSRQFGRDEESERAPIYVSDGSRAKLCNVGTDGTVPTAASRVFKMIPLDTTVNTVEGATPSYATDAGSSSIYAINLSSTVPTLGSGPYEVRLHEDGNWYFRA